MKGRRRLILLTFALFLVSIGGLALSHVMFSTKPLVLMTKDYPKLGSDSAPIEIVVFEDFLCHTCRYFSLEVFPVIQSMYIDRGIAKYVMVPLAFSSDSKEVANAAYSVFDLTPDAYFPFVHSLFLQISDERKMAYQDLVTMASRIHGMKIQKFEVSLKEERFNDLLEQNLEMARKAMKKNLRTPAVFVNGHAVPGISFESLSAYIEKILKEREAV